MTLSELPLQTRKRAPSKRALATKARVLDAAETVFAAKGFDGATIRDIAAHAGEPVGTIHHHGGGKERLFHQTVARRAATLSELRLTALEAAKEGGVLTVETVLTAFFKPFFDVTQDDPSWRNYARLVAHVSTDVRWADIAKECFDPTLEPFMDALTKLLPNQSRQNLAATVVFSVSAFLALLTSRDRIGAIGGTGASEAEELQDLIRFCSQGMTGPTRQRPGVT
ncbi:MAG: TetR/AcrR family transcriptional regulator [Pseudomonadota bacterium]